MAYSRFQNDDIVLSSEAVSTPIWTGDREVISKSDLTTNNDQLIGLSADYYVDIYNSNVTASVEEQVQFSVAYANRFGSGSLNYSSTVDGYSPSRTTYGQWRSLVLEDEETDFHFGNSGAVSNDFWAIAVDRARYKESLMVGSLELKLENGTGSLTLVDDSIVSGSVNYIGAGRAYNLVSRTPSIVGVSGSFVYSTETYGYFLPDIGAILVDCEMVSQSIGVCPNRFSATGTGSLHTYDNSKLLFDNLDSLKLRAQETVTSNYVFVRAKNSEFNYSINPSNITSTGELRHNIMINSPETYITTIGLYNDTNDLLAVAKLSKPLAKNFSKEALIRIKLDY